MFFAALTGLRGSVVGTPDTMNDRLMRAHVLDKCSSTMDDTLFDFFVHIKEDFRLYFSLTGKEACTDCVRYDYHNPNIASDAVANAHY